MPAATTPRWTINSDIYYPSSNLSIVSGTTWDALSGNDVIQAKSSISLTVNGSLILGAGDDTINYFDYVNSKGSITGIKGYIYNYGLINMGVGNDTLRSYGLVNYASGIIDLGDGQDYLNVFAFTNSGKVYLGAGNDKAGFGTNFSNASTGLIDLGSGSDNFGIGSGTTTGSNAGQIIAGLDSEVDRDLVTGNQYSLTTGLPAASAGDGLRNSGLIATGGGNDLVTGQGTNAAYGINNSGTIRLESGDDVITDIISYEVEGTALSYSALANYKGIINTGTIDLGTGNDLVRAYTVSGTGTWNGGDGTDTLSLGKNGTYVVSAVTGGYAINSSGIYTGFEQIGTWDGITVSLFNGTYDFKGGNTITPSLSFAPTAAYTISANTTWKMLSGDDTVRVAATSLTLTNNGSILMGAGNDKLNYFDYDLNGVASNSNGSIQNYGLVSTENGSDEFRSYRCSNYNTGIIDLGDGQDYLNVFAFTNSGKVYLGAGNDKAGFGTNFSNASTGLIDLGSGSDNFGIGSGTTTGSNAGQIIAGLDSEVDRDLVTGNQYSLTTGLPAASAGDGLRNSGLIATGGGNDLVTGQGTNAAYGINNSGTIRLESGDDVITDIISYEVEGTALSYSALANYKGIINTGTIDLGTGNDLVRAYTVSGTGTWNGGDGTDTLSLGKNGTYVVSAVTGGFSINGLGVFSSFEQIGAWNSTNSPLTLQAGTYTISNNASTIVFA